MHASRLQKTNPKTRLKTLKTVDDNSFNGLTDEVKGDAYLAMKNTDKAREAYQQALKELPNAESIRPLLQMKFDNLARPYQLPNLTTESDIICVTIIIKLSLVACLSSHVLTACNGFFEKDNTPEPKPLKQFTRGNQTTIVWSVKTGSGSR